jgi:hypothetical protein
MVRKIKNVSKSSQRRKKKRSARIPVSNVHERLNLDAVEKLYSTGLIEKDIASVLGLSERTINRYKANDRFKAVVTSGRKVASGRVVRSLYQRALGYNYAEVTMEPVIEQHQENGEKKKICTDPTLRVTKTVIKHVPAEQGSIEFYLTNILPNKFKKKVSVVDSGGNAVEPRIYQFPVTSGILQVPKS